MIILEGKDLAADAIAKPLADIKGLLLMPGVDANFLLYEASKRNCIARMKELVSNHSADVNSAVRISAKNISGSNEHRAPPLFAAVVAHAVEAVGWLLEHGADPNCKCFLEDTCCITPLWSAADDGNVRIGKVLLDHGADVNAAKSVTPPTHPANGNTPLYIAVQNHHPAMISLLLNFNADPNKHLQPRNLGTRTPIDVAIGLAHPRLLAQLLNAGAMVSPHFTDIMFNRIQKTKVSLDQYQRKITEEELLQIKDLLSQKPHLDQNVKYENAKAAEKKGEYKKALELLTTVQRRYPTCAQLKLDVDRIVEDIYGVKGSDCTISIWDTVPLMTQTEPTEYVDYALTQYKDKIYRHGGIDKNFVNKQRDELWEFDVSTRIWTFLKIGGRPPGPRAGHTMFSYQGSLYLWGGMDDHGGADTRLYRLRITGASDELPKWDIVKAKRPPGGRAYHAGVVYKGKYYVTGGNLAGSNQLSDECWVLNLSTFKWSMLGRMPIDRTCHGMWAANDKLFVLGGRREHPADTVLPHVAFNTFSIERFMSYDINLKSWEDEPIIGDRIYDVSEFTVLPLYKNAGMDDDPTSVIIWGGYCELDRVNGPNLQSEKEMTAHYGEDAAEFARCQYRKRLFRFYPGTNVWKKLRPTSSILPKAQSFATEIKSDGTSLNLLIGGGYGFTADSMTEKSDKFMGLETGTPRVSNKVYHVITGNIDGYAASKNIEGSSWAYQFTRMTGDSMCRCSADISPTSPTLHTMIDITHKDFLEPLCKQVSPNDENSLLGLRVVLKGLKGRSELNGKIGRCGRWLSLEGRYEVYVPIYEGGPLTFSVKPSNLDVAPPLSVMKGGEIQRLLSTTHLPKRFKTVCFTVRFGHNTTEIKDSLFDQVANPPVGLNRETETTLTDTYHGPVSGEVQPMIRAMSIPSLESVSEATIPCVISQVEVVASQQASNRRRQNIYTDLVRRQQDRLAPRIKTFDKLVTSVTDSTVTRECGKWLKLRIQIDGFLPAITRELVVDPFVSLQSLHNHVLCPVLGWAPYNHCYAFRRIGMNFFIDHHGKRTRDEHEYALHMMEKEVWMGPKKSLAVDNIFVPFYIGSMANDKNKTLGQLFSLDDEYGKKNGELLLQYVVDLGCWWTHSISVTRYDESEGTNIPSSASVAHLMGGEGGSIPEDCGGIQQYLQLCHQLAGKIDVDRIEGSKGATCRVSPSHERWWQLFNGAYRGKANRIHFHDNPFGFCLEQSRAALETEIYRPKQKSAQNMAHAKTYELSSGLMFEMNKKCTIAVPKKPTDSCAVCGVTIALKLCSACGTVAYCSKEHSIQNWSKHKAACKLARKKKSSKR